MGCTPSTPHQMVGGVVLMESCGHGKAVEPKADATQTAISELADAAYGEFYALDRTLFCTTAYDAIESAATLAEAKRILNDLRKQNELELSSAG